MENMLYAALPLHWISPCNGVKTECYLSSLRYPNLVDGDSEAALLEYLAAPDQATKRKLSYW